MAVFKFNKDYIDKELKRKVKADEPVEMTIKRADEIVKSIRKQSGKFKGYEEFEYERIDNKEPDDPPADPPQDGEQKQDQEEGE